MAGDLAGGNLRDEELDAVDPAAANITNHGHDVYELHAVDMIQPEPQKTRSKLRLLAILIALDVSF
jgi:hypothetical protein